MGVDYLLAKRFSEQGKQVMFSKDASVVTHLPSSLKYFILTELRWLTALISIEGPNYRSLACNITVVGALALILAVPVSKIPFLYSLLFNSIYITKRAYLFLIASRQYKTNIRNIFGFVILSYIYHVIGLISHIKYFLGLSKGNYLCQGQRY